MADADIQKPPEKPTAPDSPVSAEQAKAERAAVQEKTRTETEALKQKMPDQVALAAATDEETKEKTETPEDVEREKKMTEAAREYFQENLRANREKAEIFQEMLPTIEQFEKSAKMVIVVCKCMDGRTQTNDHKWIPPTSAINRRSHGGKINTDFDNREFWNVVHNAANKHKDATLLVIHAAHRSDQLDSGCAAFMEKKDVNKPKDVQKKGKVNYKAIDDRARQWMNEQASSLNFGINDDSSLEERLQANKVMVLSGMTNTDTGAMDFTLDGQPIFSAEKIMGNPARNIVGERIIRTPADIFDGAFFYVPIPKDVKYIGGLSPKDLLEGTDAPFFKDMHVKIAFEAYLMDLIVKQDKKKIGEGIIDHEVLASIQRGLGDMENKDVQAFLTYVAAGNIAYATHYRNLNEQEKGTAKYNARLFHAELKVAYSETGHDLDDRNSLLLIKPSAIDDSTALKIGRDVLIHNLENLGLKDKLPPLVHINIERDEPIDDAHQLLDVQSRMQTKLNIINSVFGKNVRILTTYSYNRTVPVTAGGVPRTKQFFPYNPNPHNKQIIITPEEDIGHGIDEANFSAEKLHQAEKVYTDKGNDKVKKADNT